MTLLWRSLDSTPVPTLNDHLNKRQQRPIEWWASRVILGVGQSPVSSSAVIVGSVSRPG